MKTNILQLTGALILILGIGLNTAYAELAIIVHKDNTATFTDKQLENIFLMKTNQFPDGEKARIVIPVDQSDLVKELAQKVCKRKVNQVQATWKKMLFTGKGKPVNVSKEAQVIEKVSSSAQYIGIIDVANTSDSIKVVKTF